MEPIETSADNSEVQQIIDDPLEQLMQDFNEFRGRISQSTSSNAAMNLEDLIDLYIENTRENSFSTTQTTRDEFTAPQANYEGTVLQTVTINSHIETSSSSEKVAYIKYGDLNRDGAANSIVASVFGGDNGCKTAIDSLTRFFGTRGGMNFLGQMGTTRMREKRKYRRVIETEEETANRIERAKIKNRETVNKAQEDRQAREDSIQIKLSKLHKENEYLKKLVKFSGHQRNAFGPEPLRRTISGPPGISSWTNTSGV